VPVGELFCREVTDQRSGKDICPRVPIFFNA
jgi:hypothetical protein